MANIWSTIRAGVKAVPAVKYAVGVAGVAAAAALAFTYFENPRAAFIGTIAFLILMILLLVFAATVALGSNAIRLPALLLTWTMVLLLCTSSILVVFSVFFDIPKPFPRLIRDVFGDETTQISTKPERPNQKDSTTNVVVPVTSSSDSIGSLDVSYARLFGAYQVPAILFRNDVLSGRDDTLAVNFNFGPTFRAWDDTTTNGLARATTAMGPVGTQIRNAFQQLMQRPRDVQNPLTKIAFDGLRNGELLLLYLDRWNTPALTDGQIATVEGRFPPIEPGVPRYSEVMDSLSDAAQSTGFLFLVLENTSSNVIRDAVVGYELISMERLGARRWSSPDSIVPAGTDVPKPARDSMHLPNLGVARTLLIPLAVYQSNEGGYPASFRSSVLIPRTLRWAENGRHMSIDIPRPRLERAAKVPVPIGWYQQ